jgi:DNA-binding CsgD family transcriptional regulator/PAS domain-containing protein
MTPDTAVTGGAGTTRRTEPAEGVVDDGVFLDAELTADAVSRSGLSVAQVDLATHRLVAVSDSAAALLGADPPELLGRLVSDFVDGEPTGALPLLATGRLDGFEAQRRIRRVDGSIINAYVWAHVLGLDRPARFGAVFVLEDGVPAPPGFGASSHDHRVVGTVDDEWRIDRISLDAEAVLGYRSADLAGALFLAAVNPHDLPDLLAGLAHVHATSRNAVVRLRVRRADMRWIWCRARLAALGDPPRFAFTLRPLMESSVVTSTERLSELEGRLGRIAHELRSVGLPVPSSGSPVMAEMPELASLTSREWETLSRLADGGRVAGIATTLGLSQSTVRNHLSAIFRKLNVGSQSELLSLLSKRASGL